MTDLTTQRRIAANVLGVGVHRIWLNPDEAISIAQATTRGDIRDLIESDAIKAKPVRGVSRGRARLRDEKVRYGHRSGHGSRKGRKGARTPKKRAWITKIRALRAHLKELRSKKGGEYKSVAHIDAHLKAQGYLK